MRSNPHPRIRLALLCLGGVSLATALVSICLAVTVTSPSRSLRPMVPSVDSMYIPVYLSMTAAGLLILATAVVMASARHGNRAMDLAGCLALLAVPILALASLGLAASIKTSAQPASETSLLASLKAYGPNNASAYKAWDDMQTDLACCAVRTNQAQDNYQQTPWFQIMREGNPYGAPKIPNSCCSQQARAVPSQLTDCTTNLPSLPQSNSYMNRIGCFEALQLLSDAFSSRFVAVSALLLFASSATLAAAICHLLWLTRSQLNSAKSLSKLPVEFAYMNHGASAGSLTRGSLASLSIASAVPRPAGRSPAPSVYSGGGSGGGPRSTAASSRLSPGSAMASNSFVGSVNSGRATNSVKVTSRSATANQRATLPSAAANHKGAASSSATNQKAAASLPAAAKAEAATETPAPQQPMALKAQPVRSGGRGGRQQKVPLPAAAANQRATSPRAANHRPASSPEPVANQRASASLPATNHRATSPPKANQRATSPPAANQGPRTPPPEQAANQRASASLPAANQKAPAPKPGQQTLLTSDGKRESYF